MVKADDALRRIRRICLALPDVTERASHGMPTFFIRDRRTFVTFANNHHKDGRIAVWCAAPPGAAETLIGADPLRFFRAAYVAHLGWVGLRLDVDPDWKLVAAIVDDAYHTVAAKLPRKTR
jgi:predicted DNA-binding protein (MmcQ/YjbR family)